MKAMVKLMYLITSFLLFQCGVAFAGDEGSQQERMAAPLAEMMFYEAAEQAVEDGYATIIPDAETSKEKNTEEKDTKLTDGDEGTDNGKENN